MSTSAFAPHRFSIGRKVMLGFGLLLAMFGVIALVSFRSTHGFIRTAEQVARAHQVLEVQAEVRRRLMAVESARLRFLVSGAEASREQFESGRTEALKSVAELQGLAAESQEQKAWLARLQTLLPESFAAQRAEMDMRAKVGAPAAAARYEKQEGATVSQQIEEIFSAFEAEQRRILDNRSALTRQIANATTVTLVAGTLLTFVALLIACSMILRDIAARRRAEEALATEHNLLSSIMDTMPDFVFLKDAKGRFILDNAAHRRYLGLSADQSIEGRTVADFYTSAAAERSLVEDRTVMETGQPILHREHTVQLQAAPSEVWLETTKVPLRDHYGTIVGLVGISSDITARKTAEEQLKRFAGQLERSNAELQHFASVASHDLQEPLRKIQAFGGRLKVKCGEALGDQGRDYLDRMQNAAERMQVLIQDLLKLSRVTSRAQPFEACDLGQIMREVLSDLEVAIETKAARLAVGALPIIEADPLQMRQLFQNLISNGLKFHLPGEPPRIAITSRIFEAPEQVIPGARAGDRVCEIVLRDHGIGFEQKFADQIFVVFQRLHTRAEYEGTGIGLAVCRKISDRHGGRIVAESSPGQGATFRVTLPVVQPSAETNEPNRSDADHDPDGR